MSRRRAAPPPIEEVARIAERLAVLLSAGVSPVSAWDYLMPPAAEAEPHRRRAPGRAGLPSDPGNRELLRAAARAAHAGDSVADAIAAA
ncbi:hypothetical protein, partial [Cryobacterium sp. N22]|uniref:hypothetical protein n=1 Tax=Cryobacterium sp. N22 TaxID=2048290 RepID=UPI003514AEB2